MPSSPLWLKRDHGLTIPGDSGFRLHHPSHRNVIGPNLKKIESYVNLAYKRDPFLMGARNEDYQRGSGACGFAGPTEIQ
jgi:hypothetical protein